jgi:hypothetical protein
MALTDKQRRDDAGRQRKETLSALKAGELAVQGSNFAGNGFNVHAARPELALQSLALPHS